MKLYDEAKDTVLIKYSPRPNGTSYYEQSVFKESLPTLDVSIVVPCYNSQEYLSYCLDSLLKQECDFSFEVLAVNDGSTDDTANILKKYSCTYETLKVITQKNKGFSGARNSAIRSAKGRYLMFVDSDDYVSPGYIEELMYEADKYNVDIVACGFFSFRNKTIYKRVEPKNHNDRVLLNGCFWGKAFRRQLFEHIMLPEGYWFEDSILAHLIYPRVRSYSTVSTCTYAYRSNPKGITIVSKGNLKSLDSFYITDLMLKNIKNIVSIEFIKSQDYYELLIEQFYLNERRILKLPLECQYEVFKYQSEFIRAFYDGYHTNNFVRVTYERALRDVDCKKAIQSIKLDSLYKLLNVIMKR